MPFEDSMIEEVMAKYQGLDRQQVVDCAEVIKNEKITPEMAEEIGDLKILDKAARTLQAKLRKAEKDKAEHEARIRATDNAVEAEMRANAAKIGLIKPQDGDEEEKSLTVTHAEQSDYVPATVVEATEYITASNTIDPKRDFYNGVQGQTLTKTGLDKLARCAQISTEVVDVQVTDEMILAKVRGWIGPKDNPIMETMDVADYSIRDKTEEFIIEKLNKGKVGTKDIQMMDDGRVMFVNPVHNIKMKAYLIKEKEFAVRATVSKAENRVKRKLLGLNSMDAKEAKMLKDEFERVNGKVQRRMN